MWPFGPLMLAPFGYCDFWRSPPQKLLLVLVAALNPTWKAKQPKTMGHYTSK